MKQRINWLARHVYPSYLKVGKTSENARIINEAPIVQFTIGDLFRKTPGVIRSLEYDWDMAGAVRWELTKDMIMPQMVRASISIDILHNKFMQNASRSAVGTMESSDFYEFIRPDNRGITPLTESQNTQNNNGEFTPDEADKIAGESYG